MTKTTQLSEVKVGKQQATKTYGIATGQEFVNQPIAKSKQQLAAMKKAGFTDVRFVVSWYIVQPKTKNEYNWTKYDQIFAAVTASGLRPMAVIAYTPQWARLPACSKTAYCQPADPATFGIFAGSVAKRYSPTGLKHYEIWNEENIKSFWQPTPSAASYAPVLRAAYTSIKQVDKGSTVISGGMSGVSVAGPGYIEPRTYLQELYTLGLKDSSDIVGYHAYTYPESPTFDNEKNAWNKIADAPQSLQSIMARNGDGSKSIWVTEYGAPTNGPGVAADSASFKRTSKTDHVNESYQDILAKQAASLYQQDDHVAKLFWYTWQDKSANTNSTENFFGLVDAAGRQKPALQQLTVH